jgi:hypothetical protein
MSQICGHCKHLDNNYCKIKNGMKGLLNEACENFEEKNEESDIKGENS